MEQLLKRNEEKNCCRKRYVTPHFVVYGLVRDLTKSGTTSGNEGSNHGQCMWSNNNMCSSERRVKENIVRIGDHPLGFGIYLFDYRSEFKAQWGRGRQFGVMIDEVEPIVPRAVALPDDGYKRVDYGMLGITRCLREQHPGTRGAKFLQETDSLGRWPIDGNATDAGRNYQC